MSNQKDIKLVALDLDGTLFSSDGKISQANVEAIKYAIERGVHVVIASGRHYKGLNLTQLEGVPLSYAITTNGASVYRWNDGTCIFEDLMTKDQVKDILTYLGDQKIFTTMFSEGEGIVPAWLFDHIKELPMPADALEEYYPFLHFEKDLFAYQEEHGVEKFCFNFYIEDGELVGRQGLADFLYGYDNLEVVCGGFNNLECTRQGVNKGTALHRLADHLGLEVEQTMAIGDTENDLAIIKAAGVGVAMANGDEEVKAAADYITASNDEDGVAKAIYHFI